MKGNDGFWGFGEYENKFFTGKGDKGVQAKGDWV